MKFERAWKTIILLLIILGFLILWQSGPKNAPENLRKTDNLPTVAPENPITEANTLYIAKLGITVPVVFPKSNKESDIQEALLDGIAHYPGTALAGQTGNIYIVGHSSDNPWSKGKYTTIFATLPQLVKGDEIKITDSDGKLFAYLVIETKIVSPRDLFVLSQPQDQKLLTLQTSYPIGTSLKRYVVISKLSE